MIFHSRWLAWKITNPHQCCARILVGCGTLTLQWFSEAVQVCPCKLGQSSVCCNHNNKSKTSTMAPWSTDSNHCQNNNVCPRIPQCMSLFVHDCATVVMAIPHCTLTTFSIFTQISPHPSLLHTCLALHHKTFHGTHLCVR